MAEQQPGQVEQSSVRAPIFTFRDQVKDFARPNLFQVEIYAPPILSDGVSPSVGGVSGSQADANEVAAGGSNLDASSASAFGTFLVKAANIPSSVVGVVDVPYRGRMLKIAGDRTFEPWTVTVLNDQSFKFRAFFEAWSSNIQALQQNYQNANTIADYQAMAKVRQFDRQGAHSAAYEFVGIWPSNISAIDLAWDSNDTPEEYTVEFQVQYWTYDNDINTGNNSGSSQL
jgi:hypothetical protein